MIVKIESSIPHPSIRELLSYATTKVDQAYNEYSFKENHYLFGFVDEGEIVGCIGIEMAMDYCEIKHIAVSPRVRNKGIGSEMIEWVCEHFSIRRLLAETDLDAVGFYHHFGFKTTSLGEKYPGVERFLCEYER